MSDPMTKGLKRPASRPTSRSRTNAPSATKPSMKNRTLASKSTKIAPMSKRTTAEKAPAKKATKTKSAASSSKSVVARPVKPVKKAKSVSKSTAKSTAAVVKDLPATTKRTAGTSARTIITSVSTPLKSIKPAVSSLPPVAIPRQPTRDEAAALKAFERAHREFSRGQFGEARSLFVALIEQYAGVSEITARARIYLNIAEARLRTDPDLPRDADSLYDRGVIELNRGEYVAAQEMFERALKREPEAAHIHYGLAATRARLGSLEAALNSLEQALNLQPKLRVRAQHDQDFTPLRNEPDFERLVFPQR